MKSKTLIIHNPRAGAKKKINLHEALTEWNTTGLEYEYLETKYAKHGAAIAKKAIADGYKTIAVAGGDGTVNEVASELVGTGVGLAIIPMGSGNGLARHLKVPLDLKKAFSHVFSENRKQIDVGEINGHKFFCAAGTGFDAEVSKDFENSTARGLKSYMWLAFKKYMFYKCKGYTIKSENKKVSQKAFLVSIANASQFGNGAYISPQSKIDDGILDIVILKPFSKLYSLFLIQKLFRKTLHTSSKFEKYSIKKAKINLPEPSFFHCDGEVFEAEKLLKISIIEKGLSVVS